MKFFNKKNNGYTLLFAVLTATLVLGISVFILSVSTKQYQLAVAARESMYALYAADGAMECVANAIQADDIHITVPPDPGELATVICATGQLDGDGNPEEDDEVGVLYSGSVSGTELTPYHIELGFSDVYETSEIKLALPGSTCGSIKIYKGLNADSPPLPMLIADVRGYNYCDPEQPNQRMEGSIRTIERGLRLIKEL